MILNTTDIRKVVIAGGGTAGWIAAAGLSKILGKVLDITLVESEEIATVGVGEATVPPMRSFHKLLGIDEQDFMRAVAGSIKLAISFENWARIGDRYIHSFGRNGKPTFFAEFHHYWLRSLELGSTAGLGEYCFEFQAALDHKFATSPQSKINYAYHLDAALYAKFLRKLSEECGVKRVEGKIREVKLNTSTGFIESLELESGQSIAGDLFIDCTGFRGLLIEKALHTGFEDWSHWLPCDSAVAIQTESTGPAVPYTRAVAHEAGWRWIIPLQHRVGNGIVYSSYHMSEDEATSKLLRDVEGAPTTKPWSIKIRTGRRRKGWNKNCVAMGLASGFIEPLESTSIHMIITAVVRLMRLFPGSGIKQDLIDQYNQEARAEIECIRDFIIMHYNTTEREDTAFWRYCKNMEIPEHLRRRINIYREDAHILLTEEELFRVDSWTQVLVGQRLIPKNYHHVVRKENEQEFMAYMDNFRVAVRQAVEKLPSHQEFLEQYCPAHDVWQRQ